MKTLRAVLYTAAAVLAFAGTSAYAFHSGGVADCEGCHTMHNSFENAPMANGNATTPLQQFQAGPYLLQGTDQSSACLNCHQETTDTGPSGYHISTDPAHMPAGVAPLEMTPGGDFGWLKKDYTWIPRGTEVDTSPGYRHGHNIVAADYGYAVDGTNVLAPGGTYPAATFYCSSCHDPHGRYRRDSAGNVTTTGLPIMNSGSYPTTGATGRYRSPQTWGSVGVYRLLAGAAYLPKSVAGDPTLTFTAPSPAAVVPSTYNRSEATTQTRVAYGQGMSEWCANCHPSLLMNGYVSGVSMQRHPAGNSAKLGAIANNYNSWVKSGDFTGVAASSYNSMIPYEEGTSDLTVLGSHAMNDDTYLVGPDTTSSQVMCLSCHRAHASGWDSMTRWSNANEFITLVASTDGTGIPIYPGTDMPGTVNAAAAQGRTQAEHQATMYGRAATKWAPYQRSLCNKCHAKD